MSDIELIAEMRERVKRATTLDELVQIQAEATRLRNEYAAKGLRAQRAAGRILNEAKANGTYPLMMRLLSEMETGQPSLWGASL